MIALRVMFQLLLAAALFFICSISAVRQDSDVKRKQEIRERKRNLQTTVGVVKDFILIDSATEKAIRTIQNGITIDIATLNISRFNIQAIVSGTVGSIQFGYNDISLFNAENGPTFAFCGHDGTN